MRRYIKFVKYLILGTVLCVVEYRMQTATRITDGDTVIIGRDRIRLAGIDAPETTQMCFCDDKDIACGAAATNALRDAVGNETLFCEKTGTDIYGRVLGNCFIQKDNARFDLNAFMVREGYAFSYLSHAYDAEEDSARRHKKGLWRCRGFLPHTYRRRQKTVNATTKTIATATE